MTQAGRECMVDRISALEGHYAPGHHGLADQTGVILTEVRDLTLHQVAGWPTTLAAAGAHAASAAGVTEAPGPARAATARTAAVLRIEPLKWWVIGAEVGTMDAEQGATLDLSHSRTHIRISGSHAATVLNGLAQPTSITSASPCGDRPMVTRCSRREVTAWRFGRCWSRAQNSTD